MTLISHFYDSYVTGNKKALICNWIPPYACKKAHTHTRYITWCTVIMIRKIILWISPTHIQPGSVVVSLIHVSALEALCYITADMRVKFQRDPECALKKVIQPVGARWSHMFFEYYLSQRYSSYQRRTALSKGEWDFVVNQRLDLIACALRVGSIKEKKKKKTSVFRCSLSDWSNFIWPLMKSVFFVNLTKYPHSSGLCINCLRKRHGTLCFPLRWKQRPWNENWRLLKERLFPFLILASDNKKDHNGSSLEYARTTIVVPLKAQSARFSGIKVHQVVRKPSANRFMYYV